LGFKYLDMDTVLHKSLNSAAVNESEREFLRQSIRTIADYPKPGIQFRDITTLLRDAKAFAVAIAGLIEPWRARGVDKVAGIEARGFILGGAVAHGLGAGFVPIRKRGKLPHETVRVAYSLEYGVDEMEMHKDAIRHGEKVLLIDDLIATGGTATAAARLLEDAGADMVAACFVVDLPGLGGAARLRDAGIEVQSLLSF
jgi:adenine phosphoribosyltransferase